jgi:hypothetical protein
VLPVNAAPPGDMDVLIDQEIAGIRKLLQPHKRRTADAAARLRPLLALDGSVTGRSDPPRDKEIARAERGLRVGTDWRTLLPGLASLQVRNHPNSDAGELVLQIGKAADAVPVRLAKPGEDSTALA